MKKFILPLLFVLSLGCMAFAIRGNRLQDSQAAYKYFSAEIDFTTGPLLVKEIVDGNASGVIVDVRRNVDFQEGCILGAINVPFDQYNAFSGDEREFPGLSKTQMNYIYCYDAFCSLSQFAAKKFAALGYPVKEMKGGFDVWKKRKYPMDNINNKAISTKPKPNK